MAVVSSCPDLRQWQGLLSGQMPEREAAALAEHLTRCDRCLAALQALQVDDTLVAAVQQVRAASPGSRGEAIARLMQRWRKPAAAGPALEHTVGAAPGAEESPEDALIALLSPPQRAGEVGRLAGYRILKVLGSGGMGVVFLAEDTQLERQVALKLMKPESGRNPAARQRFLREAKATAALKNDHVITIHQVGEDRGVVFLAMEFLHGEALDRWLERGRKPTVGQILRLGREMARGLAAAHERGLIHRDIKPGNIWLEAPTGRVKILDFGLARSLSGDAQHLTQSGMIVGTPSYMAPEQARAEAVDHRSDLFSLGCVLYRLCTGQLPFQGKDVMSTLMALGMDNPRPVRDLNPEVPPALSDLVMQLLAKDRNQRPASAKQVVATLQTIERSLASRPTPAVPVAAPVATIVPSNPWQKPVETAPLFAVPHHGPPVQTSPKKKTEPRPSGSDKARSSRRWPWFLVAGVLLALIVAVPILLHKGKAGRETKAGTAGSIEADGKGIADYALSFDGRSHVDVPSLLLDLSGPLTMEATITQSRDGKGQQTPLYALSLVNLRGGTHWAFHVWGTTGEIVARSAKPIIHEERTHVAGVYSGKELRLFVDGDLVSIKYIFEDNPPVSRKQPLNFSKEGFVGVIDEVRISKAARYDRNFNPTKRFEPDQDTLALYHCDEGQGDVLKDSSGNGHHGKIKGATWVKADGSPIGSSTKPIDLLSRIDPNKDALKGTWERHGADLIGRGQGGHAVIEVPYQPPDEYDFVVEFTRTEGNSDVSLALSRAGRSFKWCMAQGGVNYGFDQVDGKGLFTPHTDLTLQNGRSYLARVEVRKGEVTGYLNGWKVSELKTDYSNLTMFPGTKLRKDSLLGLTLWAGTVTFHRVELVEVTGHGKLTR